MTDQTITVNSISNSILKDMIDNMIKEITVDSILQEQILRKNYLKSLKQNSLNNIKNLSSSDNLNTSPSPRATPYANSQQAFENEQYTNGVGSNGASNGNTNGKANDGSMVYYNTRVEYSDRKGKDIYGNDKQNDSARYFSCSNCSRKIAGGRFAQHIDRCLGGRNRQKA